MTSLNKQLVFIGILFFTHCTAIRIPENEFVIYRTGNFIQNEYNNSGLGHWKKMSFTFSRTDTSEIIITKSNLLPEDTSYYRITWVNNSTYERTYLSGNNKWKDSLLVNGVFPRTRKYFIHTGTKKYYIERSNDEKDTIWLQP